MGIVLAFLTGAAAGGFAGAMGVGGGVIMVPVLTEALGFEQTLAQGTSLAAIIVTATVAAIIARRRGLLDARLAIDVAIGGLAGAVIGAVLATQVLDDQVLRRIFGAVVLVTALRLALRLFGDRGDGVEDRPPA